MPFRYGKKSLPSYLANSRRVYAARRIQRSFRKYRKYRATKRFNRKVNRAVMRKEPLQYTLQGFDVNTDPSLAAISVTPQIVASFSNIPFNNQTANAKFCRTSQKILAKTLSLQMELSCADNFNKICLAFIRYKRSEPLTNADLQDPGAGAGPLTTLDDKPYLPCENNANFYYNSVPLNMTTNPITTAHPFMLQDMWNPKVVDVIKTWKVQLQIPEAGSTYPGIKQLSYFYKFNKIFKYQNAVSTGASNRPSETYNNQNYYLVAWSDSKVVSHPQMSLSFRMTFKDLD